MEKKAVISLIELAERFSRAKGMDKLGYQWLRKAPGRAKADDRQVGNSLAVLKAIRIFNANSNRPIEVFKAKGYDDTPKRIMVIGKEDIIRLKGSLLRSRGHLHRRGRPSTRFKILGKVDL